MADTPVVPARQGEPPGRFRATVHGTCFADREHHLDALRVGDELLLIPGPPTDDDPSVWVHLPSGDLVGHLPPEIERWLMPWIVRGGHARAHAVRVGDGDTPSWRRLIIEVETAPGREPRK